MSAVDDFATIQPSFQSPLTAGASVTPSDSTDLTDVTRAVYVGVAGDLTVVINGGNLTISGVTAGSLLPIRVSRILATGTTATKITAFW